MVCLAASIVSKGGRGEIRRSRYTPLSLLVALPRRLRGGSGLARLVFLDLQSVPAQRMATPWSRLSRVVEFYAP